MHPSRNMPARSNAGVSSVGAISGSEPFRPLQGVGGGRRLSGPGAGLGQELGAGLMAKAYKAPVALTIALVPVGGLDGVDLSENRIDVAIVDFRCILLGEGSPALAPLAGSEDHRRSPRGWTARLPES